MDGLMLQRQAFGPDDDVAGESPGTNLAVGRLRCPRRATHPEPSLQAALASCVEYLRRAAVQDGRRLSTVSPVL